MAIKAGWYKFNGVLTAPSQDLSVNIPFKIHVELSASVGMDEYTCSKMKVMADGEVRYVLTEGNIGSAESGVEFPYELTAYKGGWRTEYGYIDTIEVQADTEVSDEFVEWFAISTNPTDEPDEPDTPDVPDTTKVIKAGTYRFNDELDVALSSDVSAFFDFTLSTNVPQFGVYTFNCYYMAVGEQPFVTEGVSGLYYSVRSVSPEPPTEVADDMLGGKAIYTNTHGWYSDYYSEAIKTITIPNDTEVSEKFYTWFNANAKIYTTISGTWIINNVPMWTYEHIQNVNFISNGKSYIAFNLHNGSSFETIRYYYSGTEFDDAYYNEYDREWYDEAYKTITFEGEQSVSQQFVDWFIANATEVVEDKPLATIAYNGSTIASLLGGQKATLKCAGMTMESDVVVDVAEVDIPEGDIPEGYVKPEGALYISRNGTHDVTNFAEAVVNVKAEAETPDQNSVVPLTITENGVYEAPGKPDYKIEWDGNTEGLERVGQMYFVSDFEINDVEELNGIHGVYINGNSTEESELTFSPFSITGYEGYQGEGYFSSGLTSPFCWYVPGKGFAFNKSGDRYYTKSITIPEGGDPIVGYSPITVNVKSGGGCESEAEKFFAENFPSDVWAEGEYTNSSLGVPITMRYLYRRDRQDPKEIAFVADVDGGYDELQTANLADYYVFASFDVSYTVPVYDDTILLRNPVAPIFFDLSAVYSEWLGMEVSAILNATLCAMKDGTYDGSGSTYLSTQANFSAVVDGDFSDVKLTTILANKPTSMTWTCEADHASGGNITGVRYIKNGWLNITENGNYSWSLVEDGFDGVSAITVNVPTGGGDAEKYIEAQHAEVNLPNATSIKQYAFYNDRVLTHIEMPKVTSIGNHAFNGCSNLALTSLPSVLTSIGIYTFNGCTSITAITFGGKPNSIEGTSFANCSKLTTINVPWAEGEVANAPWGATNATINYNYTGE